MTTAAPVEDTVHDTMQDTAPETPTPEVVEDLLVEDVSIDGMCGVY